MKVGLKQDRVKLGVKLALVEQYLKSASSSRRSTSNIRRQVPVNTIRVGMREGKGSMLRYEKGCVVKGCVL